MLATVRVRVLAQELVLAQGTELKNRWETAITEIYMFCTSQYPEVTSHLGNYRLVTTSSAALE